MKTTLEINVDDEWINRTLFEGDDFVRAIRAWSYLVLIPDGYLLYERIDDPMPTLAVQARVVLDYQNFARLPERWHLFDRDAALRTWSEGIGRFGSIGFSPPDAPKLDVAVQLALFGEVRYG